MENCIETLLFGRVCDACDGGAVFKMVSFGLQLLTYGIIVLATIGIIVAGVMYLTARDNAQQTAKAKHRMLQVAIGIAAYALMFVIAEFIIPGEIMTSTLDTKTSSCPEVPKLAGGGEGGESGGGEANNDMGDLIARAAAVYSWPIQSWQKPFDSHYVTTSTGDGKSYGDAENGKCYTGTKWTDYGGPKSDCVLNNGRITYKEAGTSTGIGAGAYCDRFVSITLYSLGLNDGSSSGNFPHTGPTSQNKWLSGSSNWKELENRGKDMLNGTAGVEQLKPGDVFALEQEGEKSGHVAIYVGSYGGSYGTLAEASASGKWPRITNYLDSAYVRVIGGQSKFALSDTRVYHIYRYTGKTTEAAESSPFIEEEPEEEPHGTEKFERQNNVYINREGLPYILHVPEGATDGMPLVIYMHGVGEVKNPNAVANLAPVKAFESSSVSNKFIAIAPVQPDDSYSRLIVFTRTEALVNEIISTYKINTKRVYIYGFSLGGGHTWCMVDRNPNLFAAAVPMSMGTGNSCNGVGPSAANFVNTPIWAICGGRETQKITQMQNFVNAINSAGGSAKFDKLGNYDHGQTQKNANYDEILTWLLSHKK